MRQRKKSIYSISKMSISPATRIKFHRKQAVLNLNKGNYSGFRYHSQQVAKINTNLVISRSRLRKKV
jgi:hypothetical protein